MQDEVKRKRKRKIRKLGAPLQWMKKDTENVGKEEEDTERREQGEEKQSV